MPLDSGDVVIAPDGTATGDGLAKLLYDSLADEHDAFPGQVPARNTPGAQESLAKLARGISEPIAIAVNDGVDVTANPGEVVGNELDAVGATVAHPLTPAQLNAIVGSTVLAMLQALVMAERAAGATLAAGFGQFFPRNDSPSAPYFRDDTNVDRKLLVAPAALTDLATSVERRVVGRADAAGTGVLTLLTGAQLGAILRFGNPIDDLLTTGSVAQYPLAAGVNIVTFNGVTNTIHGILAPAEIGQFLVLRHVGAGSTTLVQDSTTATTALDRLNLGEFAQNAAPIVLSTATGQQSVVLLYFGSRWQRFPDAIANDAISNARLRDSLALSVIGRAANTNGDPADIVAANDGEVLRRAGVAVGFGTVATAGIAADAVTNAKLADMAARTVKGRADAAGTGDPQDLTGVQLGAIVRMGNQIGDALTTGVVPTYAITSATNNITFNSVTQEIHGFGPGDQGQIISVEHIGAGTTTLVNESATATSAADRMRIGGLPANSALLVLGTAPRRTAWFQYLSSRWIYMGGDAPVGVLLERAAGDTLTAAYGQFFAHNDTPNNPYFRDDTNADRKITTAPVPLTDLATQAQGTSLGRSALGGTGVPVALTGLQQGENLRRATAITDAVTTGVVATYVITETTTHVIFTGSGTITLHGATIIAGKPIEWSVDTGAAVAVTFINDGAPTITQERFRTPSGQPSLTIRAGESVSTIHYFNRHRMGSVCKRIDPELLAPVRNSIGALFVIGPIAMTATGAAADDVVVYTANAPFPFRSIQMLPKITGGALLGTVHARNALAGGGAQVSPTFGATIASDDPAITANNGLTGPAIALNGTFVIRRSSGNITGEVDFVCVRT